MADDKLYTPEVIQDTPFPGDPSTSQDSQSQSTPSGTYKPATTSQKPFKKPLIAQETIGQALNTRSKKILQEFDLVQSGGIKVGNYQEGNSGDLRITPNGITARDQTGATTFAIDGTTGDAVFKGQITGGSMNINNQFTVDSDGNVVARSISLTETNVSSVGLANQVISSTTPTAITDTSITFTLERTTIVLLLANLNFKLIQDPFDGNAWDMDAVIDFEVDGVDQEQVQIWVEGGLDTGPYDGLYGYANTLHSGSMHHIKVLEAGDHTAKLVGYVQNVTNNGILVIRDAKLSIVTLGTPL